MLTRKQFKNEIFKRDKNTCVLCESPAIDAHHIIDRKCYPHGGYYVNNGVALCSKHHIEASN